MNWYPLLAYGFFGFNMENSKENERKELLSCESRESVSLPLFPGENTEAPGSSDFLLIVKHPWESSTHCVNGRGRGCFALSSRKPESCSAVHCTTAGRPGLEPGSLRISALMDPTEKPHGLHVSSNLRPKLEASHVACPSTPSHGSDNAVSELTNLASP